MPATTVVTNALQGFAARAAERLGMPGYHHAVVEHPIFTRSEAWVAQTGDNLARVVVRHLISDRVNPLG